mgnify:CR=1 FL=1
MAAPTSLLQNATPELADLRHMYKVLEYVRHTADAGIVMRPIPFNRAILAEYSDSSWANAEEYKSQFGFLIILTTRKALDTGDYGSILDKKSARSKRTVRSTLAA